MKKLFKYLTSSFFQWLSTGIFALLFVSCMSYYPASYQVESVLAVTKAGDTIQVPLSEIKNNYKYNYYNNWQFYNGASWLYWNDLYIRYPWYSAFNREFFYPQYRYYLRNSNLRPQRTPIYRPRPNTPNRVESATPRGSNSNSPRVQPNRVRNNAPAINRPPRTTPNVQPRPSGASKGSKINKKQ